MPDAQAPTLLSATLEGGTVVAQSFVTTTEGWGVHATLWPLTEAD